MRRREPIIGALLAAATVVAAASVPFRGLNLWSLWLVEAAGRFVEWRAGTLPMEAAFSDPNGVLPFIPWMCAVIGGGDALLGLRVGAALAGGILAFAVFAWGCRLGRWPVGLLAVFFLWVTPRFWGAVTVPSATIFVVAATVVSWRLVIAVRDDARWFGPALLAGAFALGTAASTWLWMLPLAWVVMLPAGGIARGEARIRPTSLLVLALPVACVVAFVALTPWLHDETGARLGSLLGTWIERPAEPFLVSGTLFGPARPWPWSIACAVLATTPVTVAVAAMSLLLVRWVRGWSLDSDAVQEFVVFTVWAVFLPVLLRSAYHGGADLLLFAHIAACLAAATAIAGPAWAAARANGIVRAVPAAVAALLVLACAAVEVAPAAEAPEGFRSGWVGGEVGAGARGFARYPHGPLPPPVVRDLAEQGARRFAILTNAWELGPVFERYRRLGLVPQDATVVGVEQADAVLIAFDDTLPELYVIAPDWASFERAASSRVIRWKIGSVTLFAGGLIR